MCISFFAVLCICYIWLYIVYMALTCRWPAFLANNNYNFMVTMVPTYIFYSNSYSYPYSCSYPSFLFIIQKIIEINDNYIACPLSDSLRADRVVAKNKLAFPKFVLRQTAMVWQLIKIKLEIWHHCNWVRVSFWFYVYWLTLMKSSSSDLLYQSKILSHILVIHLIQFDTYHVVVSSGALWGTYLRSEGLFINLD